MEYCADRLKEIVKAELEHLLGNLSTASTG